MNDSEVKIKARDEKIKKLSKYIRELEKKIDEQNIDLIQMRSVYQGNVELQDINTDLEKRVEILQRKIERLKGDNNDR